MEETYKLEFKGYRLQSNVDGLPTDSGIYGVYTCTYDAATNTVDIHRLVYIGKAENFRQRISPNHDNWSSWTAKLDSGQELCFSYARLSNESDRKRAEAAMIYKHKPTCNDVGKHSFGYNKTTVRTSGKNDKMFNNFTVNRC